LLSRLRRFESTDSSPVKRQTSYLTTRHNMPARHEYSATSLWERQGWFIDSWMYITAVSLNSVKIGRHSRVATRLLFCVLEVPGPNSRNRSCGFLDFSEGTTGESRNIKPASD